MIMETAPEVAFLLLERLAGTVKMNMVKTAMGFVHSKTSEND